MTKKEVTARQKMLIFINLVISSIAGSMLATALMTALPPILTDLNISATTGQWLTSGYSLAMAITMPLTAFLINRFSTKKLYCFSLILFLAGLLVCASATNFPVMMAGRLLQAAGSGVMTSMSQVVILTMYFPAERGTKMGWYGLSAGAAPVIAPVIAGLLVDSMGWRMIFVGVFAIMTVSLICALFFFTDVLDTVKKKFDVTSFVLSAFAFGGVTLGIGGIGSASFFSVRVAVPLGLGAVASVLFTRRQLRLEDPFLELRTLKNRDYTVSVLGSMLLYFIMMGSSIILPLYIQRTLGLSATVSGIVMLPGSLATALVSPFAGKIYDKVGMRVLFIAGSGFLLLSNILMGLVQMDTALWIVAGFNLIKNVAIGCMMMPLVTWGASTVGEQMTAHATALLTSLRTIAGAIGSAVFVSVLTVITAASVPAYGDLASIHGVKMTFLAMAAGSVVLLLLGLVGTRPTRAKAQ